jgi:hypothetical protein
MRSRKIRVIGAAIAAMGLAALAVPTAAMAHDVAAEIEKIRKATMKYNDVKVALAEGFVLPPPGDCISAAHEGLPAKLGAMGLHYINPKLLKISQVKPRVSGESINTDFTNPSIVIYEPQADGSLTLVAVENMVFLHAWKNAGNLAPPIFAGRIWDTMADNVSTAKDEAHGFEPHHDQHVYFRKMANPEHQLMPFSPNVTCKHHKAAHK